MKNALKILGVSFLLAALFGSSLISVGPIEKTEAQFSFPSEPPRGIPFVLFQSDAAVEITTGTVGFVVPPFMNGKRITDVIAGVDDKGITGTTDIQVRRRRAGAEVNVLTTEVTIGDQFFANDEVVNASNNTLLTGDILYVDVTDVHSGTPPNGLGVVLVVTP